MYSVIEELLLICPIVFVLIVIGYKVYLLFQRLLHDLRASWNNLKQEKKRSLKIRNVALQKIKDSISYKKQCMIILCELKNMLCQRLADDNHVVTKNFLILANSKEQNRLLKDILRQEEILKNLAINTLCNQKSSLYLQMRHQILIKLSDITSY